MVIKAKDHLIALRQKLIKANVVNTKIPTETLYRKHKSLTMNK